MSDIEDRLRAELWARAQHTQPEDLRDLRVPSHRGAAGAGRRPGGARLGPAGARQRPWRAGARQRRWLAPAVAALAVVAVAGVVAGVRFTSGRQPAPAAAGGGRPPFYVTLPATGNSGHPDATVRVTATGAILGRVSLPGTHFTYVSAAADDRTFVLAAYRRAPAGQSGGANEFYRLTLTASGRPGPLARLPLTVKPGQFGSEPGSMALSADGTTLAVVILPSSLGPPPLGGKARIEVVSLRTGRMRSWTAPGQTAVESLSWVRGGTLAFLASGPLPSDSNELRFLATARPAGSLAHASRPVRLSGAAGPLLSAVVTGHGRLVVAFSRAPAPAAGQLGDTVLAEFSAATGRRLRVLETLPSRGAFESYAQVWSADPSGEHLLAGGNTASGVVTAGGVVKDLVERAFLDRIDRGRVTALPDPGGLTLAAAW